MDFDNWFQQEGAISYLAEETMILLFIETLLQNNLKKLPTVRQLERLKTIPELK